MKSDRLTDEERLKLDKLRIFMKLRGDQGFLIYEPLPYHVVDPSSHRPWRHYYDVRDMYVRGGVKSICRAFKTLDAMERGINKRGIAPLEER